MSNEHRSITVQDLSCDQKEVYDSVVAWNDCATSCLMSIGGYAGTGKSTIISVLAKTLKGPIAFCAFTGKASGVLRKKLRAAGVDLQENVCKTIHSLIYRPFEDSDGKPGFELREQLEKDFSLIILDEASMVSEDVFYDLGSFGVPILAVGDHGQLPPVSGDAGLMSNPQLRLERIHRQAEGSRIIQLSTLIRETGKIPIDFAGGSRVKIIEKRKLKNLGEAIAMRGFRKSMTQAELQNIGIVCYMNATRVRINKFVRAIRFGGSGTGDPVPGDQVICLKNKRFSSGYLYNGMRGFVQSCKPDGLSNYLAQIHFADDEINVGARIFKGQFNRDKTISSLDDLKKAGMMAPITWHNAGLFFDYGYALTAHKAQGSSFEDLLVICERPSMVNEDDWRRWLYTAVTRASETCTVVV